MFLIVQTYLGGQSLCSPQLTPQIQCLPAEETTALAMVMAAETATVMETVTVTLKIPFSVRVVWFFGVSMLNKRESRTYDSVYYLRRKKWPKTPSTSLIWGKCISSSVPVPTVHLTPIGNPVPGYQDFFVPLSETIVGLVKKIRSPTWSMVRQWLLAKIFLLFVVDYLQKEP